MVLVEHNVEFLYWSLFTFDWAGFFSKFLALSERSISFFLLPAGEGHQQIAKTIRDRMRGVNTAAVDGSFLYLAYPSSFYEAILRDISENKGFLLAGLGFLDDEFDMVRNSHGNLRDFSGRYYRHNQKILSLPAFVVASGPSLDRDVAFIKENADRALVISCG
ncbi:MAG: hypothetical protein FJX42_04225, partial [Alphaproteobacteria bacterium]|nr:hypothetical protein [Alphaproteobacteria bacterium]